MYIWHLSPHMCGRCISQVIPKVGFGVAGLNLAFNQFLIFHRIHVEEWFRNLKKLESQHQKPPIRKDSLLKVGDVSGPFTATNASWTQRCWPIRLLQILGMRWNLWVPQGPPEWTVHPCFVSSHFWLSWFNILNFGAVLIADSHLQGQRRCAGQEQLPRLVGTGGEITLGIGISTLRGPTPPSTQLLDGVSRRVHQVNPIRTWNNVWYSQKNTTKSLLFACLTGPNLDQRVVR